MTGRERIEALLAGRPADRPPFCPAVYEHKAALVGATPSRLARDAELLERALEAELDLYQPDILTVGLDVYNVEAEAAGARVRFYETNDVPSVESRPIRPGQDVGQLPLPDPARSGRMYIFLEAGRRVAARHGREVFIRGALSAPFSMACELAGAEPMLLALLDDPEWSASLLDFCSAAVEAYGKAFVDRGLGIVLFDSHASPPLVSPELYRRLLLPPTERTIRYFRDELGVPYIPYIVGGDTAPLFDGILATGTNGVLCDFKADLSFFIGRLADSPVLLRANLDPRFLQAASAAEVKGRALEILALGRRHPRFVLGTGILPYDLDPAKVIAVRDALSVRP
jgi:uroporphyrinogen decarboxylase